MPRRPSQPAAGTRSSSQVCPKPHVTRGCPNAGWDPICTDACGPWQATFMPQEPLPSLPALTRSQHFSLCSSLVHHLSVDHLAWLRGFLWQGRLGLAKDTTGSFWATAGSHSPATFPKLLFALTPTPPTSLDFGLPLPIQHSTLRGSLPQPPSPPALAASYHHLPANNKVFSSEAGPKHFPISVRGTQNCMMYFPPSYKLPFSIWGCSGACLFSDPAFLSVHLPICRWQDTRLVLGRGESGHPKFSHSSHWTGVLNFASPVLHFKHLYLRSNYDCQEPLPGQNGSPSFSWGFCLQLNNWFQCWNTSTQWC